MFIIAFFGIEDKEQLVGTCQNLECPSCGAWGRGEVYKFYRYLHLFFIPTFRWNVRYYVKTSCCGGHYELDPAVGKAFEKHPATTDIRKEHLRPIPHYSPFKRCPHCHVNVPAEFRYCPYCGGRV